MPYVLPFTYIRPETLPACKEIKGSRKLEWPQTRLRETLGLTKPSFDGLLKQLDNYFEHHPARLQGTGWTWISFEGDNDRRAKLCRELGAIDFGSLIARKVLGLETHRPALAGSEEINVTGYLLYQTAMASERRTLARAVRQGSQAQVTEGPLARVTRQTAWM